jgi:hypothetical protein
VKHYPAQQPTFPLSDVFNYTYLSTTAQKSSNTISSRKFEAARLQRSFQEKRRL